MKKIKIVYSGGGTLGPVTPLIGIHNILTKKFDENYSGIWIGTKEGIEEKLVTEYQIPYVAIAAGKLRRYISVWNMSDLIKIFFGFFQAFFLLIKEKPTLCISAGGFVSVPVHYAAWILGIPTWIHQQDVQIGLANKLMTPIAQKITTVLKEQTKNFPLTKTFWLGNPVRSDVCTGDKNVAQKFFKLKSNIPVVLVTGGGTGSQRINELIIESIQHLDGDCQMIHLSGKERPHERVVHAEKLYAEYYQTQQFLGAEMKLAYAIADVVICRGGFGTLSELASLKKAVIVIPKPGHQMENAQLLHHFGAVILVDEETADGNFLAKIIKDLLVDKTRIKNLGEKLHEILPSAEPENIVAIVKELVKI